MNQKAMIAMSGGVDSSVAAALMLEQGYECVGVNMKLYHQENTDAAGQKTCCSLEDAEDARSVALELGMKFYVFNFTRDFAAQVIDRFIRAYEAGDTPNPCIDCNRHMKFEKLCERAKLLDCDVIVTGHYARVEYDEERGRWLLKRAKNREKDQSYVLYFLTQQQLAHAQFPLGDFSSKDEVRRMAEKYGFVNAKKHDSQDICFVPDGDYAAFIRKCTGKEYPHGAFVDQEGNVLGEHKGMICYTIGQRKGLGLSLPAPLYVCRKCMERNEVVLSPEKELYTSRLVAADFNWIAYEAPKVPVQVTAKTRYRAKEAEAEALVLPDGRVQITFAQPQRAITKGQAVVLYDEDIVVGGGTIVEV